MHPLSISAKHNTSFLWETKREFGSDSRISTLSIRQLHLLNGTEPLARCLHSVLKKIQESPELRLGSSNTL